MTGGVAAGDRERRIGLIQLVALILLFAAPIVASWVMYLTGWTPSGRSNHGTLVSPVVPLPKVPLTDWNGESVDLADRQGNWLMLLVMQPPCDEDCRDRLGAMARVHRALARGRLHVDRAMVLLDPHPPADADDIRARWPDMRFLRADEGWWTQWDPVLRGISGDGIAGRLYIVDPLGNLMMQYAPGQPAMEILEDLRHLLKVTQYH